MLVVSFRQPEYPFERRILASLGLSRLDGIATNNVLVPALASRNLPNEHDIVVLLRGRVVTIDGKDLWAGAYRGSANNWEYRKPGRTEWEPVHFMGSPVRVAFRKAAVMVSWIQDLARQRPGEARP